MSAEIIGKYFGTEINEKWWRRYTRDKMLARGNGVFSYDKQSISFLRLLTKTPIVIKFEDIVDFKVGKWHAGQWGAGRQIMKVLWKKDGQTLSSGFFVTTKTTGIEHILSELKGILEERK